MHQRQALDWLLEIANSTITYRMRYLATAQLIPVLDLLLLDTTNPHALLFQITALIEMNSLLEINTQSQITSHNQITAHNQINTHTTETALPALAEKLAALNLGNLESSLFGASNTTAFLAGLADLLDHIALACGQLSDRLHLRNFAHVDTVSQQMVSS